MNAIRRESVAAVALVAGTYIYFLLFAQFGFLQGIRASDPGHDLIRPVLAAMAIAGVAASLAAPRVITGFGRGGAMVLGFLVSAGAAASAAAAFSGGLATRGHLTIAAVGVGAGLGLTTVGLAADLRRLTRARRVGLHAGLGTGLAYFCCNVPAVYGAQPVTKAWIAALVAATSIIAVLMSRGAGDEAVPAPPGLLPAGWRNRSGLAFATAAFFALVWFDSAAFAALQLTPATHERLWGGGAARWSNGLMHAGAAIIGGTLLDRGHLRPVLAAALLLLGAGATLFAAPGLAGVYSALVYVVGVSLYSTALAAFAALAPTPPARPAAAWRAAWVYAVAGWIGSATGATRGRLARGMDLRRGRLGRVRHRRRAGRGARAPAPVGRPGGRGRPAVRSRSAPDPEDMTMLPRRLTLFAFLALPSAALLASWWQPAPGAGTAGSARGREVYIEEGCIHCHSQYIRPGTQDEAWWGEAREPEFSRQQSPALIGNRRQGPDLMNVGLRLPRDWQRRHLIDPRSVSPASRMPGYPHLFAEGDPRGEALLDYLYSLGRDALRPTTPDDPPPPD